MNIVLDSNIVMSILIKADGITSKRLKLLSNSHQLFIHQATIEEIEKHEAKLIKASKLGLDEFKKLKSLIISQLSIIYNNTIPLDIQTKAFLLVSGIDENDTAFVATSIYLEGILWSGDKPLYEGLKEKGYNDIYTSADIQSLLL